VDPHLALDLDRLQPIEGWPGIEWGGVWGILGDPYQKDGAVPLPDGAVETIGELIRELAASDPDPKVRSQAWWLPRRLRSGDRDHHRDECRLANQVLTQGQPANQRDRALRIITTCGPLGGVTIGQLLRDHRHEGAWTEGLEEVVRLTADLADRSIYNSAVEIAADPAAGTAARVQALRVLYYQITPGSLDPYESFLPDTRRSYVRMLHGPAIGEPLPPDAVHELFTLASGIAADPATNDTVRSAATKLHVRAEVKMHCADTVTLDEYADRILKPDGSR
jgi:hypothetical protein